MESLQTYELEEAVLGCLLLGAPIEDISEHVSVDDFQSDEHRKIFNAIDQQIRQGKPVDAISLLDQGLDISAINKIYEHHASAANASHYAKQLADYSITRQVRVGLAQAGSELTPQNHLEVISELTRKFDALTSREIKASYDWQQVIEIGIAEIDTLNHRQQQTILSGLPSLDAKFAAIHGARLIIVGARPGAGKTALAQQIALTSAKQKKAVGIISLEMSIAELAIRSFASVFEVNGTSLARGDTEGLAQVIHAQNYSQFSDYKIFVDDSTYFLESIIARISQWKRKYQLDFVIIDHIGLINITHKGTRNEALGIVSRSLKQLCKRLNMPILCLCQLSRSSSREDREPTASDLYESGHIEQDGDFIIILSERKNDDIYAGAEDYKKISPYIVKNRVGPKGNLPYWTFKGRTQRFVEEN